MCVTHFHLLTLADTAHMCSDTINCASSISPFFFQRQEPVEQGVCVHGGSNAARTSALCKQKELQWCGTGLFLWGGQIEDAGARPPAGLRRWALFDPPPTETTSLRNIVHLPCSGAAGPAEQGHGVQVNSTGSGRSLCLGLFSVVWPTAYSRSIQRSLLVPLRS